MNDDELEQSLRALPEPKLPGHWRGPILATARRAARQDSRANLPPLLAFVWRLLRQNPITASGLAALWVLILVLKAGTPIDPAARDLIARTDPNQPPPLFLSAREEILLAESLQRDEAPPILLSQP